MKEKLKGRSNLTTKAKMLREMFDKEGIIRIAGAHDGITAKLVETNHFDGVWASGLGISTSYAVPSNILTMTQYLQAASVMNDAVSIPVIADCGNGYGNSNNVIYMVKKYEAAGIAAVAMDDKKFTTLNKYSGRQELAPITEFMGKILAAKNAQETKEFMVIAVVNGLVAGWGREETLRRTHSYVEAGADAILIQSKSNNPEEIVNFTRSWDFSVPLVIDPTLYSMMTLEEINQLGIKMLIYENHGLRASIRAINDIFSDIRKERLDTINDRMVSMNYVSDLLKEEENLYLKSEEESVKVIIPAAGRPRNQESLETLLQDRPIAMLDIWGKSILQRNIEVLNKSKLYDIFIIKGYNGDSFNVDGVTYLNNPKYQSEHILSSIMQAEDKMNCKTIIIYSDILFENHLIERLKYLQSDFIIVVDNSFKNSLVRNKKLELVVTEEPMPSGNRILIDRLAKVKKIGDISLEEINCSEFIGACMFSKKGIEIFKKEYHNALVEYNNRKFYQSKNIFQASLTDMLQHLISLGHKVEAMQVNSGWMEIHTFDNYKYACSIIR